MRREAEDCNIKDVYDEIDNHKHDCNEESDTHDCWQIEGGRSMERIAADARPAKNCLNQHGTCHYFPEHQTYNCHDRRKSGPEDVPEH
jgi:hypothetical protein